MLQITSKEIIEFTNKSSIKAKRSYASRLKTRNPKQNPKSSGGDYWTISTSSIYNTFKDGKDEYYDNKIFDVKSKIISSENQKIITMYHRNLNILMKFKDFNINQFRPNKIHCFQSLKKEQKIININEIPIYINPNLVFCFEQDGKIKVGGILFTPNLTGYKKSQLGLFSEILYKFLEQNYSNEYKISEEFCIAIDTYNVQIITYKEVISGNIKPILNEIISEIKAA